jgi:chemotaxis protein methyltransferase WspC
MDTSLDRLKTLLKQHIGLDANSVGEATVRKMLNQRMRSCNIDDSDTYLQLVDDDPQELAELLETAIIPETWFFRDSKPFAIILQRLQQHLLTTPQNIFNILSIPCSTGEEPYSLAMFLLQAGMPAASFHIDAIDVSHNSLQLARQGGYGKNSFRGNTEEKFLLNYFNQQGELFIIDDRVKQCVDFSQVNILDNAQLPCQYHFEVILCRNLLIYFDVHTKQAAFRNLHKMLKDDGILFIGHSEFGAVPAQLFVTTSIDNTFGLIKPEAVIVQKARPASNTQAAKSQRKTAPPPAPASSSPAFSPARQQPATTTEKPVENSVATADTLLDQARTLADAGSLDAAEELCLRHVDHCGDSAEAFFLLGLINQASGNASMAETLFRKALYLQPKHYETLVHLSLLVEQQGDLEGAGLLRQRAQRAQADD